MQIVDLIERRRCSRRDAVVEVQGRSKGYAGVTARQQMVADSALSDSIATAVEKALSKAMERLTSNLSETLAQVLTSQMIQLFSPLASSNASSQIITQTLTSNAEQLMDPSSVIVQDADNARPSTSTQQTDNGCFSGSVSENNQDVEMDLPTLKRTRSPNDNSSISVPHSKTKKFVKDSLSKSDSNPNSSSSDPQSKPTKYGKDSLSKKDFLKDSILEQAVSKAGINSS